jgi:hypothetical protein
MTSRSQIPRKARRRLRIALPVLLLASAAFAKPPIPAVQLQAAQQAIATAERVDAGANAAVELGEARAKLSAAQRAVGQKEMLAAAQLADESRASAELAAAKSGLVKAKAVNQEMKDSTATLVDEMRRQSGDSR